MMDAGLTTVLNEELTGALQNANSTVVLVSPFLSLGVALHLSRLARVSTAKWQLLTNANPSAVAGGFLSTEGLRALMAAGVSVSSRPNFHAKVYLADGHAGFVGSANLTRRALGGVDLANLELSVRLSAEQARAAGQTARIWFEAANPIDEGALRVLDAQARNIAIPIAGLQTVHPEGASAAEAATLLNDARGAGLWVKAIYREATTVHGVEPWFSSSKRGKPSFAPGDLVLIYAKGIGACDAIVEVLDAPRHDPDYMVARGYAREDAGRWPWVNEVRLRLEVPMRLSVTPADLGFTGQSLQGGH